MKEPPGYQLPAGEAYTDELACTLVFYPDKPEYRRALTGSLAYLSTWLAWERDTDKRGKDAARAWKNALDETLECMNMACLEELLADVARIRTLLETKKDCCDDSISYYPTEEPITEISPQIGDPPEYYGETAVADWDEWLEHVCYNAHKYVDYLKDSSEQLQEAVSLSSIFIGLIGASLALLGFAGLLFPVPFALAAAVVAGIVLLATSSTFQDTADDFEAARDDIVCALFSGTSLSAAVESALGSGTDWDLFYQFIDYEAATAIIYEGGWDDEYLPAEMRDDCLCDADARFVFQWPTDVDGWEAVALTTLWDSGQYITMTPSNTTTWRHEDFWPWDDLATRFSFSLPVSYDQVKFRFQNYSDGGSVCRHLWQFYIYDGDDVLAASPEYDTNDFTENQWNDVTWNMPETFYSGTGSNQAIYLRMYRYSTVTPLKRMWFDDFGVYKR